MKNEAYKTSKEVLDCPRCHSRNRAFAYITSALALYFMIDLSTSVNKLRFIGPIYATRLSKLEIKTVGDLINHFPTRYIDFSLVSPIGRVQAGETVTIRGQIIWIKNEYTRSGKKIQKAKIADSSGYIEVVWFNQPFLIKTLPPGAFVAIGGKADWFGRKITIVSPEYEILRENKLSTVHTGRLVPVYPETSGLSSKWLRSRIAPLLEVILPEIKEFLPTNIREKNGLIEVKTAFEQIHFPKTREEAQRARKRLAFDELFLLQLSVLKRKREWEKNEVAHKLTVDQKRVVKFLKNLPFELTAAQKRSVKEILEDLARNRPMNRLLEGDVGSGKTVVAATAMYVAATNGYQAALMAPTQILALQHQQTLQKIFEPLDIKVSLITSFSQPDKSQKLNMAVGTHALIQKSITFENLALVVIDEQHRFGVKQRGILVKKGKTPHVLTMTATPIPRTVALTLYADLDLSILDEMPPGRRSIKTWVVPPQKRGAAYNWIREQIKEKQGQAFIVCPLIEQSEKETLKSVKAAKVEYEGLSKDVFPELSVGLIHGRLKPKEKEEVIEQFRKKHLDILVATPVVEVGIDIPDAQIMLIETAERFGLAALHQLRGRVGRSEKQSYCLLFTEESSEKAIRRLKALEEGKSGMELAELDLAIRGPGEIYGTAQHGFNQLKIASFSDLALIKEAQVAAKQIFPKLEKLPILLEHLSAEELIAPN